MDPEEFESELQFATSMQTGAQDALYWSGYRRGLLRARFGRRFSSNPNHFAWRDFKEDDDPVLAELGRGYVDGINTVVNGKPPGPRPLQLQGSDSISRTALHDPLTVFVADQAHPEVPAEAFAQPNRRVAL